MNKTAATRRETSTDYSTPHRPALIAALNRTLGALGIGCGEIDPEKLLNAASHTAALADYGSDDFMARLSILTASMNREALLTPTGRFMASRNIVRMLVNRLRIESAIKRDPCICDLPMQDPVFIIGLQRTGTTAMHRLIASDDEKFRHLASWEAINPAPYPGKENVPRDRDPRIFTARMGRRALEYLAPDFFAIHPVKELDPEEDCLLFDYDFWSTVPEATMRVPTYSLWLERQDHTAAYRYYKKVLSYLYSQHRQGRWILKTPQHMEHLNELFAVFPDARVIQTHRDPVRVIASFCSMIAHAYGIFSDEVDPAEIGRHWSAKAVLMVKRSLEARENYPPDRFIDIAYRDIVDDPESAVRKIYETLGLPFSGDDADRIRGWKHDNPQHRFGRHRYRAKDFALDVSGLRKQFLEYTRRFKIPEERDE